MSRDSTCASSEKLAEPLLAKIEMIFVNSMSAFFTIRFRALHRGVGTGSWWRPNAYLPVLTQMGGVGGGHRNVLQLLNSKASLCRGTRHICWVVTGGQKSRFTEHRRLAKRRCEGSLLSLKPLLEICKLTCRHRLDDRGFGREWLPRRPMRKNGSLSLRDQCKRSGCFLSSSRWGGVRQCQGGPTSRVRTLTNSQPRPSPNPVAGGLRSIA